MTLLIYLYKHLINNYQSRRPQNVNSVEIKENIDRPRDIVLIEEFLPLGNHLDTLGSNIEV